jgi:hypothetical protein
VAGRDKLPKATLDFALGEEKFGRFLAQTELVNLPPQKVLDIGMAQLKAEQEAFAEAAKKIDPNKPAIRGFQANPERASGFGQIDPGHCQRLGQASQIRCEPSVGRNSVGGSRESKRNPAISARHLLCLDGYCQVRSRSAPPRLITTSHRRKRIGRSKKRRNGSPRLIITPPTLCIDS